MRRTVAAALWSATLVAAQGYRTQPGGTPPGALADSVREAVWEQGVRVVDSRGYRFCEVWLRRAPLESGAFEEAFQRGDVPDGTLVGVIEYFAPSADRTGRGFARGLYTLRISGEDSVALIPASADRDIEAPEGISGLRKGVLWLARGPAGAAPRFEMSPRGEWILHLRVGETPVSLLVTGVAR